MELTNHSETLGSEWDFTNRNGDFKHFKKTVSQLEMIYKFWRKTIEFGPNYCQEHNLLIDGRCIYIYRVMYINVHIITYVTDAYRGYL